MDWSFSRANGCTDSPRRSECCCQPFPFRPRQTGVVPAGALVLPDRRRLGVRRRRRVLRQGDDPRWDWRLGACRRAAVCFRNQRRRLLRQRTRDGVHDSVPRLVGRPAVAAGTYHWKSLAVAWAGLQWTRPDGFIIGGAWAIARLLFTDNADRRELFFAYLKALGLSLVLYSPWLVFTTAYYGTPVPHTVVAKSVGFEQVEPSLYGWINHFTSRLRWILEPACFSSAAGRSGRCALR